METNGRRRLRKACRVFANCKTDAAVAPAVEALAQEWAATSETLRAAVPALRRLAKPDEFREWVHGELNAGRDVKEVAGRVEARLAALEAAAEDVTRPGGLAERLRALGPRVGSAEMNDRLEASRGSVGKSARGLAEAVRRALAARREQGVSLYKTYANEAAARQLITTLDAQLGLDAEPAGQPASASDRRPPWGMFRVRAPQADEKGASPYLGVFRPFPVRSELLRASSEMPRVVGDQGPASPAAGGAKPAAPKPRSGGGGQ